MKQRQPLICQEDIFNHHFNSTPPEQYGCHLTDSIFKCIFMNVKSRVFWLDFHWSVFQRVKLTISRHWSGNGAWCIYASPGGNGSIHQGWVMHICIVKPKHHLFRYWCVIWLASSHFLNQSWIIVNRSLRNRLQWNLIATFILYRRTCIWNFYF